MSITHQSTEGAVVMSKAATAITYGGAGGAIASGAVDPVLGLSTSQWSVLGVVGGLIIALLGFAVNVYFKRQHLLIALQTAKADLNE